MIEVVPTASATAQALLDLTLMAYCTFSSLRMTVFSLHCILLYTVLFTGHLTELQRSLAQLVFSLETVGKAEKRKRQVSLLLARLTFYQTEHARIHTFVAHLNRQLVSRLVCVGLCANILANVVILNFLLLGSMGHFERAFITLLTFTQFTLGLACIQMLIRMVAPLYTCGDTLYRAQGLLGSSGSHSSEASGGGGGGGALLSAKIRLNTFIECVCSRRRFTFTAGALSKITKKALFKVRILSNGGGGVYCLFLFT